MQGSIQEFGYQSFLAYAAYAVGLEAGSIATQLNQQILTGKGVAMADSQLALQSLADVTVVAEYQDSTGAAMTLFEKSGQYSLAVRGTEITATDLGADLLLAAGIPARLNPQYSSLQAELSNWVADPGILGGKSFTVTGHSLGGYLASALKGGVDAHGVPFSISDAYLFNSPGMGGIWGQFADSYQAVFGFPPAWFEWNLESTRGSRHSTYRRIRYPAIRADSRLERKWLDRHRQPQHCVIDRHVDAHGDLPEVVRRYIGADAQYHR